MISRRVAVLALMGMVAACRPAESGVTLRFWAFGREGEVVQELVHGFELEHPGVHVRVQQIPWSAAHEKLLTAIVGRAAPDVAQMGNTWIPEMVTLGALAPVDLGAAASSYFPGILATNTVNDTLYGLPWYADTRVLFYRKDLLARAGFAEMPTTWEGWRDAMKAIKRGAGPGQYALLLPLNEWPLLAILGLQAGSELIDSAGFGQFSGAEFERAFSFVLALYADSLAAPVTSSQVSNLYQEFERGTFAMYISGPWNLGEFRRRLPASMQDAWATAPLPGPDGEESRVSLAGGSSLVVFRSSPRQALAQQLIEYLSRPEQQAAFYRLTGDLPARRDAWTDATLANDRTANAFRLQLDRTVPTPMVPEWEEVTTKLMDNSEAAIRGSRTPRQALADLDADVDRVLERRRYLQSRQRDARP
ncbi:MAG: sugar ABC transporter substrate-binding protein [Gemmatimonadales bacterium]